MGSFADWSCRDYSYFFLFVYPYPAKRVYEFRQKRQKELNDIRQDIENKTLLSEEDSHELKMELFNLREEFSRNISRKDEENKLLKKEVSRLKELIPRQGSVVTPEEIRRELKVSGEILDETQENILVMIGKKGGSLEKGSIFREYRGKDTVIMSYHFDSLVSNEYIEVYSRYDAAMVRLTLKGKEYLVKNNLLDQ